MQGQEINITHKATLYDVTMEYHSALKCQNYELKIKATEESDGRVTLAPGDCGYEFVFNHSDPDRVIALAEMIKAFAQMVKRENIKSVDTASNE